MTDVNCIQCGVVNLVADETCTVCGVELRPLPRPVRLPEPEPGAYEYDRHPTITSIPAFNGVGDVLGPTFNLFFTNLWLITKIVVVIVTPFEIFKALSIGQTELDVPLFIGMFALELACKALIAPALIYSLMKLLQTGTAPGVNEAYRCGLGKLVKLSLCALMAWALQLVGYAMLIIPGIILSLAFTLVYPIAVLDKYSPWETIKRSYNLTTGYRLKILGAGILMAIVMGLINIPVSGASAILLSYGVTFWPLHAAAAVISDILEQSTTVLSLIIYLSILRTLGNAFSLKSG